MAGLHGAGGQASEMGRDPESETQSLGRDNPGFLGPRPFPLTAWNLILSVAPAGWLISMGRENTRTKALPERSCTSAVMMSAMEIARSPGSRVTWGVLGLYQS